MSCDFGRVCNAAMRRRPVCHAVLRLRQASSNEPMLRVVAGQPTAARFSSSVSRFDCSFDHLYLAHNPGGPAACTVVNLRGAESCLPSLALARRPVCRTVAICCIDFVRRVQNTHVRAWLSVCRLMTLVPGKSRSGNSC